MSPEEKQQFEQLKQEVAFLKKITTTLGGSLEFKTLVQQYATGALGSATNVNVKNLTIDGTITHDGGKVGFFGATPVVQASHIGNPSGGATIDSECRAAVNSLITVDENLGFTAKS